MELELNGFLQEHGLWFACMAMIGIFVLGVLKYFKLFDKISAKNRKYVYAGISVAFSMVAVGVYLACVKEFSTSKFFEYIPILFAMNQSMYAFYETMGIRGLFRVVGNRIITLVAGARIAEKLTTMLATDITGSCVTEGSEITQTEEQTTNSTENAA